jgi:hypothetical protein
MRVLIACEHSGTVRDAFRARGHDAWSCDLLPDASPAGGPHIQRDVLQVITRSTYGWDLMIAHPPCTYLASSGIHWNTRRPERAAQTEDALAFFDALLRAPIDRIAIENPIGVASTRIRKPDQIIHPYMFGDDASKATCLWLKGLPRLIANVSQYAEGREVLHNGKYVTRYANQTDSGQNKLGPSPDRWALRSKTYPGIANAMAAQWSAALTRTPE